MPRLYEPRLFGGRLFQGRLFGGGPPDVPPGPATVTFTDNANGTGAVATIAGDDGATHTVYVTKFDETFGNLQWTNAGSRLDDGTVALALSVGHYIGFVMSANAAGSYPSMPQYFTVTTGLEALHYRCLEAVRTRLGSAGLNGLSGSSIITQHTPSEKLFAGEISETPQIPLPGIVVCPYGAEIHDPNAGTNYRVDFTYPCLVAIFAAQNMVETTNVSAYLKWREQAILAFADQRLPGVREIMQCTVDLQTIVNLEAFAEGFWASAFIVNCEARRIKGLGV